MHRCTSLTRLAMSLLIMLSFLGESACAESEGQMKTTMIALLASILALGAAGAYADPPEESAVTDTTSTSGTPTTPTYRGSESEATPIFDRANDAYEERNYEEAIRLIQQAYEAHEHPELLFNLGQANRLARHHEEALAAYRQYLQLVSREELYPRVYISISECLIELGRRQEANEALQHYLNLESDGEYAAQARRAVESGESPTGQDRRDPQAVREAQELHDRAVTLWEQGQHEEAALLFLRGYQRMPDIHEFARNAGLAYLQGELWADASRTFLRYVSTPGAEHDAWAYMGEGYREQDAFPDAAAAYERYLELEPNGQHAAQAREFVNEYMPADWHDTSLGYQPTRGESARARTEFNAAFEHFEAGRYREALEGLESAYRIVPGRELVYNMGRCHFHLNEWQQALTYLDRVLERGDQDVFAFGRILAAECLLELDRPAEAATHLQAYLARATSDELPDEEENILRVSELQTRVGQYGASSTTERAPETD